MDSFGIWMIRMIRFVNGMNSFGILDGENTRDEFPLGMDGFLWNWDDKNGMVAPMKCARLLLRPPRLNPNSDL